MKVIEDNFEKRVVCPNCKSVLAITREDLQVDDDLQATYRCGACKKQTFVRRNEIFPEDCRHHANSN